MITSVEIMTNYGESLISIRTLSALKPAVWRGFRTSLKHGGKE